MLNWLKRLGLVAALLGFLMLATIGAYVEQGQANMPLPPPTADPCNAGEILERYFSDLKIGSGIVVGDLTIYPLTKKHASSLPDVVTLDQAVKRGWLKINETGGGSVPTLVVSNTGPKRVLLLVGDIVVGGKQNRIIRQDTLIPPKTYDIAIPVYCGEHGRWTYGGEKHFGGGGWIANPSTRSIVVGKKGQSEVWSDIDRNLTDHKAAAPTRSVQELLSVDKNAETIEEYEKVAAPNLPRKTVGIVVAHNGRIVGADIFGSADLCSQQIDKIMRGYICQSWPGSRYRKETTDRDVTDFLHCMRDANFAFQSTVGEGCSATLSSGDIDGELLTFDGSLVHLVALD